ncbi:MAG: hypothetical protein ABIH08_02455 [Candidatus Omnitrophota bacterium]
MFMPLAYKKGVILIVTAFLIAIFAVLIIGFLEVITTDKMISQNQLGDLKSMYIADAGIEAAIYELQNGGDGVLFRREFPDTADDNTYYTVTVAATHGDKLLTVNSLGEYGDSQRTVQAKVMLIGSGARVVYWKEQ